MLPRYHKTVATGTWFYDGVVPHRIEIYARPAEFAGSRYDDDEQLDEKSPIPETPDGCVYYVGATSGGEFRSLADAMAWAEVQPWGPVKWDKIL